MGKRGSVEVRGKDVENVREEDKDEERESCKREGG